MATVPSPRTWTPGELATAAYMNGIRDALNFLLNPPLFRGYQNVAQSLATSGNYIAITIDTEVTDTDNMHAASASKIIPQTLGYYEVSGAATFASQTTPAGQRYGALAFNGSGGASLTGGVQGSQIGLGLAITGILAWAIPTVEVFFNGSTDFLELYEYQASGGALSTASTIAIQPSLRARWVHA